jgi:hypothetical protein
MFIRLTPITIAYQPGRRMLQGFLPQMDEFYFTTAEKKNLENCRCSVPNFMND